MHVTVGYRGSEDVLRSPESLDNPPSLSHHRKRKEAGPLSRLSPFSLFSAPPAMVPALKSEVTAGSGRASPALRLGLGN